MTEKSFHSGKIFKKQNFGQQVLSENISTAKKVDYGIPPDRSILKFDNYMYTKHKYIIYIIESVDSINRDELGFPLMYIYIL